MLTISYDYYDYLDCNTMEYLNNNIKAKHHCSPLHIDKWLKDQFKIPKEKMYELDNTNININNKDKCYNVFTMDTDSHSSNALVSNNSNNSYITTN